MNIEILKPSIKDFEQINDVFYFTWLDTYVNKEVGITKEDIEEFFKNRKSEERRKSFE